MKKVIKISLLFTYFTLRVFHGNAQSSAVLIRKWGSFGEKLGEFKYPAMIAIDQMSNIYVVDQHNHRIQKFNSAGNFILMWGKYGSAYGEFNYPY